MIRLSKTTKMPGASWGLPAMKTCPGSRDSNGTVVPVCKACYARTGNYTYPAARNLREFNHSDWKRDTWVTEMVLQLENERWFRWFDSGDVYHPALAQKILLVIQQTPWCRHWIPTRSHSVPRLRAILEEIDRLPNARVRYSSPSISGEYDAEHGSTVIPSNDWPTDARVCPASSQGGQCRDCRACWDKTVPVVAYVGHGLVMSHERRKLGLDKAAA